MLPILPVFEGLLPDPHNAVVLNLLYLLCRWHGLAKLRMHTDETLEIMDDVMKSLGDAICAFKAETCSTFHTRELKREMEGRQRRKACTQSQHDNADSFAAVSICRPKTFNLRTYKLHALESVRDGLV